MYWGEAFKETAQMSFSSKPHSRFSLWLPREIEVPICMGGKLSLHTFIQGQKKTGPVRTRKSASGRQVRANMLRLCFHHFPAWDLGMSLVDLPESKK